MKVHFKLPKVKKRKKVKVRKRHKRGPIPTVGGSRTNVFLGDALESLPKLNTKLMELKIIKRPLSMAYVCREGAKLWLKKKFAEVEAANNGSYHAKKRTATGN